MKELVSDQRLERGSILETNQVPACEGANGQSGGPLPQDIRVEAMGKGNKAFFMIIDGQESIVKNR